MHKDARFESLLGFTSSNQRIRSHSNKLSQEIFSNNKVRENCRIWVQICPDSDSADSKFQKPIPTHDPCTALRKNQLCYQFLIECALLLPGTHFHHGQLFRVVLVQNILQRLQLLACIRRNPLSRDRVYICRLSKAFGDSRSSVL